MEDSSLFLSPVLLSFLSFLIKVFATDKKKKKEVLEEKIELTKPTLDR